MPLPGGLPRRGGEAPHRTPTCLTSPHGAGRWGPLEQKAEQCLGHPPAPGTCRAPPSVPWEKLFPMHSQSLQVIISKTTVLSPREREKKSQGGIWRGRGLAAEASPQAPALEGDAPTWGASPSARPWGRRLNHRFESGPQRPDLSSCEKMKSSSCK